MRSCSLVCSLSLPSPPGPSFPHPSSRSLWLIFCPSSGYVLKKGLEEDRDQFDLLLHCILIVTSVIPPGELWYGMLFAA